LHHTGTQACDPNVEEIGVRYPVIGLHLPLLPAPGAAFMVHLPGAQQWRLLAASGHLDGGRREAEVTGECVPANARPPESASR
jgi:hypothetical protein